MTEEETDPFVVLLSLDASQQALSAIQCKYILCTNVVIMHCCVQSE